MTVVEKIQKMIKRIIPKDFSDVATLISVFISVISLCVSCRSDKAAAESAKALADYQFEQSQTPHISFLDRQYNIQFIVSSENVADFFDEYENGIKLSYVSEEDFPIKIPVQNTGVGLAQNVKITYSAENQKITALRCKEILDKYKTGTITTNSNGHIFYDYNSFYAFEFDNTGFVSMSYEKKGKGENYTYLSEDDIVYYPYLAPIVEESEKIYFELPESISSILLETLYEENIYYDFGSTTNILDSVSVTLNISYQNLGGDEFLEEYILHFSLGHKGFSPYEPELLINVDVQKTSQR